MLMLSCWLRFAMIRVPMEGDGGCKSSGGGSGNSMAAGFLFI